MRRAGVGIVARVLREKRLGDTLPLTTGLPPKHEHLRRSKIGHVAWVVRGGAGAAEGANRNAGLHHRPSADDVQERPIITGPRPQAPPSLRE